jgi:hypothetical protein
MSNDDKSRELQARIELLQQRIDELELAAEVSRAQTREPELSVSINENRQARFLYLWNFVITASYPLVFGLIRRIYALVYRSKK